MPGVDDQFSAQFAAFAKRGCGWQVFPEPVTPEPPFRPFTGYTLAPVVDDGRVATAGSSLLAGLSRWLAKAPPKPPTLTEDPEPEPEPEPTLLIRDEEMVELQTALPANLDIKHDAFATFLEHLAVCSEPIAFEMIGTAEHIVAQFVAHRRDTPLLRRQLIAYFPEVVFLPEERTLATAWEAAEAETAVVEFGLEQEFILPLLSGGKLDPFIGLIGAMSELVAGELALFQVLFQQTENDWKPSIWRAVTDNQGKALFVNQPDLATHAKVKLAAPLYGAVIRIATRAADFDRAWSIARELAFALRVFANGQGNALVPLRNDDYPHDEHCEDVLRRQSHRSGMLLNAEELMGFVHFPSPAVRATKLRRQVERTKAAPVSANTLRGLVLGENKHMGKTVAVTLTPDQRTRHMHVIGATSTGKSTLLFNLIRQDIENGEGLAVLEPHGDLIERILTVIPPERVNDVVLIDPADEQFSVGFNILSAHSDLEKTLLASDLVSVFQRLSTSWGDQMGSVLNNAILAFLESSEGGTLSDLRRFLIEPAFRERFLKTVGDPDIVYYWRKGFTQLSGNKSIGPVLTRLETFLSPKPIRYMVSQRVNRLDFADIIDSGKIFLAKLSQGQMGKENSFLLGSLLMAKFQQAAMARQRQAAVSRRDFWLYVDEFHNFITPSMAEILSGARKYRLGLILAHQELRQLERDLEVASAVLSNPYTRVVFRVGDDDARKLESGFSYFEARDFQNLETGKAVCRIEKADGDFNLTVPLPIDPAPDDAAATRNAVIAASRRTYATPRAEIEEALRAQFDAEEPEPSKAKPAVARKVPEPASVQPIAEVPKATVSKTEQLPTVAPPDEKPTAPSPDSVTTGTPRAIRPIPAERGIGGNQHNLIRERIEIVARPLGFYPFREKPTPDGKKIDLALDKSKQTIIGCEISFSTTIDHEVGNVAKCIKAGCQHVAVITTSQTRLAQIQQAVSVCLAADQLSRVGFYLPDQFVTHLQSLKPEDRGAAAPEEIKLGKYKVKSSASKLTPAEQQEREAAAIRLMAESMRRTK